MLLSSLLIKDAISGLAYRKLLIFISIEKKKDVQTDLGFEMVCFYYVIMSSNT